MALYFPSDKRFFNGLFPEAGPEVCREEGCTRLRIRHSVLCAKHHFEMIKEKHCPWDASVPLSKLQLALGAASANWIVGVIFLAALVTIGLIAFGVADITRSMGRGGLRHYRPLEEPYRTVLKDALEHDGVTLNEGELGEGSWLDGATRGTGGVGRTHLYLDITLNCADMASASEKKSLVLTTLNKLNGSNQIGTTTHYVTIQWRSPDSVTVDYHLAP
jgi:hypothetical protein